MSRLHIALVAAIGANRVIGNGPDIPWKIPGEQKIFRRLTEGKILVMGRKTFESIGRPLPNRTSIIVSRQENYQAQGCMVAKSLEEALSIAGRMSDELFVAGGAEIYRLALPMADRVYLTEIQRSFEGDAYFPPLPDGMFKKIESTAYEASIPYTHCVYERV